MPRYGQRTNPYYPSGESDVSPEILGGMAYNPYSSGTDWGFALRNALNNLLAHKQGQAALAQEEEERQKKELQTAFENQIKEREIAVRERPEKPPTPPASIVEAQTLMESDPVNYPTMGAALNTVLKIRPEKTPEQIEEEAMRKARGTRRGAPLRPLKPVKPSTYEMKKTDIWKAVERGDITKEEGMQSLFNIAKDKDDVAKGAAIRQANEKSVADVFNSLDPKGLIKDARNSAKLSGGASPFSTEGHRLDMPRKYNVAKKNITDGVATSEDKTIVERYDAIHRIFMERILPNYRDFNSFMKDASEFAKKLRGDKEFDLETLNNLFKIYGQ